MGSINIAVFAILALSTYIPTAVLLGFLVGPALIVYISIKVWHEKPLSKYISYGIGPGLFSLILLVNSINLEPLRQETYAFNLDKYKKRTGVYHETSFLELADDAYSAYPHLCYFINYHRVKGKRFVTHSAAKGLLGIEVATKIELS